MVQMGIGNADFVVNQRRRLPVTSSLTVIFILLLSVGCQAFLPSKLTSFGENRQIIKQAENDPFPSPADVGLDDPKSKPTPKS
jgi:hypothetical protein